jgi:hypothetical protein
VSGVFPHRHGGAAAEHILVRTARARHANGANERDTPTVRDDETAQPGLVGVRHELRGYDMKSGGGVRFVQRQLGGVGRGSIHAADSNRSTRFVNDDRRDSVAKPPAV